MRFPVVLFDLDGTIVDSGWIILASYRHATTTVLGADYPDEVPARPSRRGRSRGAEREFDAGKADELARAYREFYAPLHSELQAFPGMLELLRQLDEEGRTSGLSAPSATTSSSSHSTHWASGDTLDIVVGSDDAPRGKPHTGSAPPCPGTPGRRPGPDRLRRRQHRSTSRRRRPPASTRSASPGAGSTHAERMEAEGPDAVVDTAEELYAVL